MHYADSKNPTYGKHSLRYLGPKLLHNLSKKERLASNLNYDTLKSQIRKLDVSSLLKDWVAQAAIYAIPKFPVYKTVFIAKTFVLTLLSLLLYFVDIYDVTLVLGCPVFKSSATLVNSQLVASCQLGF